MSIDISEVCFSMRGSYMALNLCDKRFGVESEGLFLRNIHGAAEHNRQVGRLTPTFDKTEPPYTINATPSLLTLNTAKGAVDICFGDAETLLVRGSAGLSLRVDLLGGEGYNYVHPAGRYFMLNVYKNRIRYIIDIRKGDLDITQTWNGERTDDCAFTITGEDGFLAAIREVPVEFRNDMGIYDFDACVANNARDFDDFAAAMPSVRPEHKETARLAAYVNWSSVVRPFGLFRRNAMLMSKNWMTNVWTWDPCFNAIALAHGDPAAAWDQYMVMFDYQDETGLLPDSINDASLCTNFCKPPIHGWALERLMRLIPLTTAQLSDAYRKVAAWTEWWLNYRDGDGDGVCEYYHGNDSGWDNATAFTELPPTETPDLTSFLIVQMDVLRGIAERLGRRSAARMWKRRADRAMKALLEHCFDANAMPVAKTSGTHKIIDSNSLILYMPILLGERLPANIRDNLINALSPAGPFLTEHGFATEPINSPLYTPDGYWRGPIWAPSTLLIVDGLYRCGAKDLAKDVARRFGVMAKIGGFAENFDAVTGRPLRDRAYTWTSSVYLILMHDYDTD